ncbi:MAG: hypothetical protein IKP71_08510 [Candidatus Riflebacteria bacterium]|nr:hypothetical protein [Candidatus Riflebacteria bacterium]
MSPIYPIVIPAALVADSSWATAEEFASIVLHIKNLCSNYPSILMAYSADFEAKVNACLLAEEIVKWGINVFMPDSPAPIAAMSYAITTKAMPIGLYIEGVKNSDSVRLIPISSHGGLFDDQDLKTAFVAPSSKKAVIGSTDIISSYIKHLAGFADPYIEKGLSFSNIDIPFKELYKQMENNENLAILFERDAKGPKAVIGNNGCLLKLEENGESISTEQIAKRISKYLKEERYASGTLLVPAGKANGFNDYGEVAEIEGNDFDLIYSAGFSDLLLSWWPDGLIAMQGSSCFGDGLLAAIYYLESLR